MTASLRTPPEPRLDAEIAPIPPIIWAIAALAILLRVGLAFATHFTWEDSLITLRYAENLAHGHGFVYNVGERVLGTTTPLYALFLALTARLGLPPTLCGKAAAILADAALCVVMYRWLHAIGQEAAGKTAAFFIAINPLGLRWAISGMETSLVTLCVAIVWYAYTLRRYRSAYLTLGVLFLLRWDSALLLFVLTCAVLGREHRLPLRELALYLLLIAPWLLFATWYFGSPIPVTGFAKIVVYGWRSGDQLLPQLGKLSFRLVGTPEYTLISLAACFGIGRALQERWTMLVPPLLWFALYWTAFLLSKVLLFEWYLLPPLPVYALFVALGLASVAERIGGGWPRRWQQVVMWSIAGGLGGAMTLLMFRANRETQRIEDNLRIPLGRWLKAQSRPTDRILLEPIGYIGYYAERPVLDVIGLVSPQVLPFWNRRNAAPMREIALHFLPEWCVFRPGEVAHIEAADTDHAFARRYALVRTFAYTPRPNRDLIVFQVYRRRD